MTTASSSAPVVVLDPVFSDSERLALAGFLAGYRGLTRDAYTLDLRQFVGWCDQHQLSCSTCAGLTSSVFARDLEERGRARATVARRLCTVAGFYRYAVEEGLLARSPAVHVRRPRLDYESHATGLDRNELDALLVATGLGTSSDHALISLLALNGLRVSEAIGGDINALGVERGHRTLTICRKGAKIVTIPLAPRTARAIDLSLGERLDGPIFLGADGQRSRPARRLAHRPAPGPPRWNRQAGRAPYPSTRLHRRRLDADVPLRDVQEAASHADLRTTMRYDRGRISLDHHATYIVAAFLAGAAR